MSGSSEAGDLEIRDNTAMGMFVVSAQTEFVNTALLDLNDVSSSFNVTFFFFGQKLLLQVNFSVWKMFFLIIEDYFHKFDFQNNVKTCFCFM